MSGGCEREHRQQMPIVWHRPRISDSSLSWSNNENGWFYTATCLRHFLLLLVIGKSVTLVFFRLPWRQRYILRSWSTRNLPLPFASVCMCWLYDSNRKRERWDVHVRQAQWKISFPFSSHTSSPINTYQTTWCYFSLFLFSRVVLSSRIRCRVMSFFFASPVQGRRLDRTESTMTIP